MNSIATFKRYVGLLDEVYATSSATSALDGDNSLVRMGANGHEIIIPNIDMDGLADHNRNGNFADGSVTFGNNTVALDYDRDRRFTVDEMDDEETLGMAFGKLSSEFVRTKVVPELDAYRMSKYASLAGTTESGALASGEAVLAALIKTQALQDEAEVNFDDRHLFITPTLLAMVNNVDTTKSKEVLKSFAAIHKIPQSRFYSAIDLLDGRTGGEEKGGYKAADGATKLNFMSVSKSAVIQFQKRNVSKFIPSELNQYGDGNIFMYREYGIANVFEKKKNGIYVHKAEA